MNDHRNDPLEYRVTVRVHEADGSAMPCHAVLAASTMWVGAPTWLSLDQWYEALTAQIKAYHEARANVGTPETWDERVADVIGEVNTRRKASTVTGAPPRGAIR